MVSALACRTFFEGLGLGRELHGLEGTSRGELARHCAALQRRIVEAEIPRPLAGAILQAHVRLNERRGAAAALAVRSSATAEDLAGASFAGQHGTYYYVDEAHLLEMIQRCWASLWSPEAVAYRATHGIPHASVFMAVVVQEMVRSEVSGVAFTANPVSGDRGEIVIESSWGMGAAIVDGRVTPDRYVVVRKGLELRERRIAEKRFMVPTHVPERRSQRVLAVPHEMQRRATLRPDQVRTVAEWALRCEQQFGGPQDVEWALADGRFYVLQSRPITALGRTEIGRDVKGKWVLFKALAENFTDPLTPLTVDLVTVSPPPGLRFIGGRLYMDLESARRLVPLRISDADLATLLYLSGEAPSSPHRLSLRRLPVALLALLGSYLVLGVLFARTRGMPDDFMQGYRALCRKVEDDPALDPVDALQRLFLLPKPLDPVGHMAILVNVASMRFMPWMGVLKQLLRRWVPDLRPDAVALLCSGSEGVLSAEMGRAIWTLAGEAKRDGLVREILIRSEPEEALARLREEPAARGFVDRLDGFLALHGHRAIKEFELQSARWEEQPAPVLGMIRNYLLFEADPAAHEEKAARARLEFEAKIRRALEGRPLERILRLRWRLVRLAARRAKYYLKQRENSRFYHIMGFGVVRKKVVSIEAELRQQGRLKCKDDVFFLRWHEVAALRSGRLGWLDVEERIRERRMEHVRLAKITPPKTIGIELRERPADESAADRLEGQSASPGRYEGIARVILDPSVDLALKPGEVLVAPYTDPAWTPLFLTAGAAVVEVGSYLSHAGTVAREFGMPCVVDVADCTRRIQTGGRVDVDGGRGVVRILGGASGT
ncbi:MAG: hypothetical protein HYS40_09190 [Gemmatimonadetes bacterium]|nr:hypothetical protein [Gemmatimonadota bacterium]